jgi:hypothetical protein
LSWVEEFPRNKRLSKTIGDLGAHKEEQMRKENAFESQRDQGGKHGGQKGMPKPAASPAPDQGIDRDERGQEQPRDRERANGKTKRVRSSLIDDKSKAGRLLKRQIAGFGTASGEAMPQASQGIDGSQISDESVPGTRLFILGTTPENRVLLWHGGYCHASVLLTDHNLRSDARSEHE